MPSPLIAAGDAPASSLSSLTFAFPRELPSGGVVTGSDVEQVQPWVGAAALGPASA
ncbi:MAG: hypothetical protein AAGH71_02060 [Planctomycetota bacterium]